MRTGKELIESSKEFTGENRFRSWFELTITLFLGGIFLAVTMLNSIPVVIRLMACFFCSLFYVRMFVIYHDYQHRAILQNSILATLVMRLIGLYLLAPENIWRRSHDHHHNHNSKLTTAGIGSYPTICKKRFLSLTKKQQQMYLINRHPLTVIFGYFTLFIFWLNVKSFLESPRKHLDSLGALILHATGGAVVLSLFGTMTFFISWFMPFFLAFGIGSYLFYCQHNFPEAKFREDHDWKYDHAALSSTSFMMMPRVMEWLTGNIGYHHVHHLNSRIPFYRLVEAMKAMPELQCVSTTSWNSTEIAKCFRLKLWDADADKMITLRQLTEPSFQSSSASIAENDSSLFH